MNIADELEKLRALHQSGALSDEEYASAKARILNKPADAPPPAERASFAEPPPRDIALSPTMSREQQVRQWGMFLHLSMLANFIVPGSGLVAPIVIWQIKKDEFPELDRHGKNALNWIISEVIYALVGVILVIVIIGIPLLMALAVVGVVFPIIAAVKANNGEVWRYPLAIEFIK